MWVNALELDQRRNVVRGASSSLCSAIRGAADLRVLTAFRHHEHVDPLSSNDELVREATDFRVTYLIDDRWVAGIENLRMPVALPDGFGPRESMSLFLYNQDGNQALARVFLDGRQTVANQTDHLPGSAPGIPRMNVFRTEDTGTNAPTQHFIYDFEYYHFRVCARWREVLSHDERGGVVAGSFADLATAVAEGREVKVGIRGLCADLGGGLDHEVFVHVGPCYEYTSSRFLVGATHPVVRVRPAVPLAYRSGAWDFGWLIARTDGLVSRWLCDPRTLKFTKSGTRHAIRWFTDAG